MAWKNTSAKWGISLSQKDPNDEQIAKKWQSTLDSNYNIFCYKKNLWKMKNLSRINFTRFNTVRNDATSLIKIDVEASLSACDLMEYWLFRKFVYKCTYNIIDKKKFYKFSPSQHQKPFELGEKIQTSSQTDYSRASWKFACIKREIPCNLFTALKIFRRWRSTRGIGYIRRGAIFMIFLSNKNLLHLRFDIFIGLGGIKEKRLNKNSSWKICLGAFISTISKRCRFYIWP